MFKGSIVAIVTPMKTNGEVDYTAFTQLLDWHLQEGTNAVVVCGSTGEAATLTHDEKLALFKLAIKHIAGRIPVIAGTGTNCTQTTLELTKEAAQIGVDACLIVTPYYNKPTQKGLLLHYQTVAAATHLPILLYNVPGRTACVLQTETVIELAKIKNIVGLKDSGSSIERLQELREKCGKEFSLLAGDDDIACAWTLAGGDGVISVTANVAPHLMQEMIVAALNKDETTAKAIDAKLLGLHHDLFCQSNPIPVKWLLAHMGRITDHLRLPLTSLEESFHQKVMTAWQKAM